MTEPVEIVVQLLHASRLRADEAARARILCVAMDCNDRVALHFDRAAAGGLAAWTVCVEPCVEQASRCSFPCEAPTIATLRRACNDCAGNGLEPRAYCRATFTHSLSASAGKRASMYSSCNVTSCGLPSVVTVENMRAIRPCRFSSKGSISTFALSRSGSRQRAGTPG